MKIYTLIQTIKANSGSVWNGREICADTTRDKVLWGDAGQECTGIISTCYASPAVIKRQWNWDAISLLCTRLCSGTTETGRTGWKKYGIPEEKSTAGRERCLYLALS